MAAAVIKSRMSVGSGYYCVVCRRLYLSARVGVKDLVLNCLMFGCGGRPADCDHPRPCPSSSHSTGAVDNLGVTVASTLLTDTDAAAEDTDNDDSDQVSYI